MTTLERMACKYLGKTVFEWDSTSTVTKQVAKDTVKRFLVIVRDELFPEFSDSLGNVYKDKIIERMSIRSMLEKTFLEE